MFHQNPQHTGLSPFPGPSVPVLKWTFQTGGRIDAAPAISGGRIYVGSSDGNLYALNSQGLVIWKLHTDCPINTTPAIGSDGTIYLGAALGCDSDTGVEGVLYAINPAGKQIWNLTVPQLEGVGGILSPTIGPDGTIYVSDYDFRILAVRPDGTIKWEITTAGEVVGEPAVAPDGTIYVGIDDPPPTTRSCALELNKCMVALSPNGTIRWGIFGMESSPAIGSDGTIYANGNAINPNGTVKWQTGTFRSPSIGTDGTIYGTTESGLDAFDKDGSLMWHFPTETVGGSSDPCCSYNIVQQSSVAIGSNGILYFSNGFEHFCNCAPQPSGYGNASLYAITSAGTLSAIFVIQPSIPCGELFCAAFSLSDPAIGLDRTVYVGSGNGKLYALGPA